MSVVSYWRAQSAKQPDYTVPSELVIERSRDKFVVINPVSGGWAILDAPELVHLMKSGPLRPGTVADQFFQYGLVTKDQRYISDGLETKSTDMGMYFFEINLTDQCNLACSYCSSNASIHKKREHASLELGRVWVKRIREYFDHVQRTAPTPPPIPIVIEFTGGEPLLSFPVIQMIVETANKEFEGIIDPSYVMQSNLTLLQPKHIDFFKRYNFGVGTSIDCGEEAHNENRPYPSGRGSYRHVLKNLVNLRDSGVRVGGIISVVTPNTLPHVSQHFSDLLKLGFTSFKLSHVLPSGRAVDNDDLIPNHEELIEALFTTFEDVFVPYYERTGVMPSEGTLGVTFIHLLTPQRPFMCSRSPCGGATNVNAINWKGEVFPCNKCTYNPELSMGNLNDSTFLEVLNSPIAEQFRHRNAKEHEPCRSCRYRSWCQAECPQGAFQTHGSINAPSASCSFQKVRYGRALHALAEGRLKVEHVLALCRAYTGRHGKNTQ